MQIRNSMAAAVAVSGLIVAAAPAQAAKYKVTQVASAGSMTGRIFFQGAHPPTGGKKKVTRDHDQCGADQPDETWLIDPKDKGLKNVVVYLDKVKSGKDWAATPLKIEQKGCRYIPHVQVLHVGKVNIVNNDGVLHNVHAYLDPDGRQLTLFNIAQPLKGQLVKKRLKKAGVVKFACDVHPWMAGYAVVRDNPYYAITDASGKYEITGIPAGEHKVVIWHEGVGVAKKTVTIEAGKSASLDLPIGG